MVKFSFKGVYYLKKNTLGGCNQTTRSDNCYSCCKKYMVNVNGDFSDLIFIKQVKGGYSFINPYIGGWCDAIRKEQVVSVNRSKKLQKLYMIEVI